jgi:TPR repeat protein
MTSRIALVRRSTIAAAAVLAGAALPTPGLQAQQSQTIWGACVVWHNPTSTNYWSVWEPIPPRAEVEHRHAETVLQRHVVEAAGNSEVGNPRCYTNLGTTTGMFGSWTASSLDHAMQVEQQDGRGFTRNVRTNVRIFNVSQAQAQYQPRQSATSSGDGQSSGSGSSVTRSSGGASNPLSGQGGSAAGSGSTTGTGGSSGSGSRSGSTGQASGTAESDRAREAEEARRKLDEEFQRSREQLFGADANKSTEERAAELVVGVAGMLAQRSADKARDAARRSNAFSECMGDDSRLMKAGSSTYISFEGSRACATPSGGYAGRFVIELAEHQRGRMVSSKGNMWILDPRTGSTLAQSRRQGGLSIDYIGLDYDLPPGRYILQFEAPKGEYGFPVSRYIEGERGWLDAHRRGSLSVGGEALRDSMVTGCRRGSDNRNHCTTERFTYRFRVDSRQAVAAIVHHVGGVEISASIVDMFGAVHAFRSRKDGASRLEKTLEPGEYWLSLYLSDASNPPAAVIPVAVQVVDGRDRRSSLAEVLGSASLARAPARAAAKGAPTYWDAVQAYNARNYAVAIPLLRRFADEEIATAQYLLGAMYRRGVGTQQRPEEALRLLTAAASAGVTSAALELGMAYEAGAGVAKDHAEAARWYSFAAERGEIESAARLGWVLAFGENVERDPGAAASWARFAARRDSPYGQRLYAYMLESGVGVQQDRAQARRWYALSAAQGEQAAKAALERLDRETAGSTVSSSANAPARTTQSPLQRANDDFAAGRFESAFTAYLELAKGGNAFAQVTVGNMYAEGQGVARDFHQALDWYRSAASQNSAAAQFNIGRHYRYAIGIARDDNEALRWYRLSASQKFAAAESELGRMYINGIGVEKDPFEGMRLLRLSADQKHIPAYNEIGKVYELGIGFEKDFVQAVRWFRLGAEAGDAAGAYNLGMMYELGRGVPADLSQAMEWYRRAAAKGHTLAKSSLTRLENAGQR